MEQGRSPSALCLFKGSGRQIQVSRRHVLDAKGQLERLLRIQELSILIREAEEIVAGAPGRIEQIEEQFRERNAEYVAIRDQYNELELDRATRSEELSVLEEAREKYKADLMEVKNQREYAAMLKEIDNVKAEIDAHEEAILRDMEAIETLKGDLATHEEHIKQEREKVQTESLEVNAAAAEASGKIGALCAKRDAIDVELPQRIRSRVKMLEEGRHGIFLTKVDNATCMSCFVRIRPQAFQEVRTMIAVHTCSNCRRFMYYEPTLCPAAADAEVSGESTQTSGTSVPQSGAPDVETVNGGTI